MTLFSGITKNIRALGMLMQHPSLLRRALIPSLLTVILSFIGVWLAFALGEALLNHVWAKPEGSIWGGVWQLLTHLVRFGMAGLTLLITPWLVMLFGFPLCGPLVNQAEKILGGTEMEGSFLRQIYTDVVTTCSLLVVGLGGSIAFMLLGFIPGVAIFSVPFAFFLWNPVILSFDIFDGSLARRQFSFTQKCKFVTGNLGQSISIGFVGSLLLSVPVLNLIGLPIVVLSGTIAVCDMEKQNKLPNYR